MDITTVVGYVLGIFFLVWSIGPSSLGAFYDFPSMVCVFGGGTAAVIISLPIEVLKNVPKVAKNVLFTKSQSPVELIARMVEFAEIARRDGILALENVTENINDEFLVRGIQLAVDGTDPELIENILSTELDNMQERHALGKKFFDLLTKYAPAWGMIGTLIGLIMMLGGGMSDPAALTSGMAVALITTMYGSVCANLLFGPLGDKLAMRNNEEMLLKMIILKGVMSIQQGDNPRIVEQKLRIFLPPALRPAEER